MKVSGIVLRYDDHGLIDKLNLDDLNFPARIQCTADFDRSKLVGSATLWRDSDGNLRAEVEVNPKSERFILSDTSVMSVGNRSMPTPEVSRYQFLCCSVKFPKDSDDPEFPVLLDLGIINKSTEDDDTPPMVIS